jgi:hypothetical protein
MEGRPYKLTGGNSWQKLPSQSKTQRPVLFAG